MNFISKAAMAAVFALGCVAAPAWAQAPTGNKCEFKKLADMTVDMSQGTPRVAIVANGQRRWVLLDTKQTFSTMRQADIAALGGSVEDSKLALRKSNGDQTLKHARLQNVLLGDAVRLDAWDVVEGDDEHWGWPDVAGILGVDLLAGPDVELDLAHNRIAFFTATNCGDASLAYWDAPIDQTPLYVAPTTVLLRHFIRPIANLNGRRIFTQLDTASTVSGVDTPIAKLLKVKEGDPGVTALTGYPKATMTGKFESFAIGGEKISNPTLNIWKFDDTAQRATPVIRASDPDEPSMVLGLDFLRAHRVLIATSQHKMYFSYNGGPVFTALKSK